jgi:hypothetical protein
MLTMTPGWNLLGLLALGAYFLLPALLVMGSRRPAANPWQWILGTLFTGWLGFIIFLAATESRCDPVKPGKRTP